MNGKALASLRSSLLKILTFEGIVRTKHAIGKRILEDILKFDRAEYGQKTIANLAKDLNVSKRDLYRCTQFAEKYPELCLIETQFSWRYIV